MTQDSNRITDLDDIIQESLFLTTGQINKRPEFFNTSLSDEELLPAIKSHHAKITSLAKFHQKFSCSKSIEVNFNYGSAKNRFVTLYPFTAINKYRALKAGVEFTQEKQLPILIPFINFFNSDSDRSNCDNRYPRAQYDTKTVLARYFVSDTNLISGLTDMFPKHIDFMRLESYVGNNLPLKASYSAFLTLKNNRPELLSQVKDLIATDRVYGSRTYYHEVFDMLQALTLHGDNFISQLESDIDSLNEVILKQIKSLEYFSESILSEREVNNDSLIDLSKNISQNYYDVKFRLSMACLVNSLFFVVSALNKHYCAISCLDIAKHNKLEAFENKIFDFLKAIFKTFHEAFNDRGITSFVSSTLIEVCYDLFNRNPMLAFLVKQDGSIQPGSNQLQLSDVNAIGCIIKNGNLSLDISSKFDSNSEATNILAAANFANSDILKHIPEQAFRFCPNTNSAGVYKNFIKFSGYSYFFSGVLDKLTELSSTVELGMSTLESEDIKKVNKDVFLTLSFLLDYQVNPMAINDMPASLINKLKFRRSMSKCSKELKLADDLDILKFMQSIPSLENQKHSRYSYRNRTAAHADTSYTRTMLNCLGVANTFDLPIFYTKAATAYIQKNLSQSEFLHLCLKSFRREHTSLKDSENFLMAYRYINQFKDKKIIHEVFRQHKPGGVDVVSKAYNSDSYPGPSHQKFSLCVDEIAAVFYMAFKLCPESLEAMVPAVTPAYRTAIARFSATCLSYQIDIVKKFSDDYYKNRDYLIKLMIDEFDKYIQYYLDIASKTDGFGKKSAQSTKAEIDTIITEHLL